MDALSLDQFATFALVADEGSFAAAARRMGRAQSAITYAIQKLEEQSGSTLFDRSGYRPQLTEAGRSLLPHARRILTDLARYRAHAEAMTSGVEAEVRLVLPEAMPVGPLVAALATFRSHHPSVQVRVITDSDRTALRMLEAGTVDLAIVLDRIDLPDWFERQPYDRIPLIVVASPDHPLTIAQSPIATDTLADHLQIVVAGRSMQNDGADHGVVAVNRWYVTDYAIKRELLLTGLGWGSMPAHLVEREVADRCLVRLEPASWEGAPGPPDLLFVVGAHANRVRGPATHTLLNALAHKDI